MLALRPMALRRAARCAASRILPAESVHGATQCEYGGGTRPLSMCSGRGGRACVVCLYRP
eukprot:1090947-Prymnesium_polylepis.1